ncbi:MAG: ABC transporter permease subunit [Pseudomonadota bacterium]
MTWALQRVSWALVILSVAMSAMEGFVFMVPGDPASGALGPRATRVLMAMVTKRMGLDRPVPVQIAPDLWRAHRPFYLAKRHRPCGGVGLLLGLSAGYGPRWRDAVLGLVRDSVNALPMMMLALAILTVIGAGRFTLIVVVVLVSMPDYARLIRAQTRSLRRAEFILAERAIGASTPRIVLNHVVPNGPGPLVIVLSTEISRGDPVGSGIELSQPWRQTAHAVLGTCAL